MPKTLIVLFAVAALGIAAPVRADEWTKKYPLSGKPSLRVDTNDGAIDVSSSEQKAIEVVVRTAGWRIPQDVQVTESRTGDHIELVARVPRSYVNLFGGRRSLRIELRVPREADLDLHSGDGSVAVQPVGGTIRIDTGDGSIKASGLKGSVRLHSGDGHIEGSGFDGTLQADTGDGHIRVAGRFDVLRLKSGDGHIDAEAAAGSRVASSWSLRSGDGSITLRVPEGINAELEAHTGDGKVTLDFPVTVSGSLSRTTIHGKLGSGGPTLELKTGDGSIRLQKL